MNNHWKIDLGLTIFRPLLLGMCIFQLSCQGESHSMEPNVVYIFADQFRQFSLGFWSQDDNSRHIQGNPDPVHTPTLNDLANNGIVFNRAVSNFPLCSPYRGMLLSGMYPHRNGLVNNCRSDRDVQLRNDLKCITDVFSTGGYDVAYFGKCHWQKTEPLFDESGNYRGTTEPPGGHYVNRYDTYVPPGPSRHSIGYFFQLLKDDHFNPRCYSNDPKNVGGLKDGELYLPKRFSTELEAESIKNYLSNTHGQRDPGKPFFLIWSMNPPHNPWTEESTYMPFFDRYTEDGTVKLNKLLTRENADSAVGHYAPYYFANVSAVDYFIGEVMQRLEDLNLDQNTIVVFSSDHGEMLGSHGRSGKNIPEIESFAIPLIIHWANKLKHRVEDLIFSVPDVMPTLMGLAGLEALIPQNIHGKNYSSILIAEGQSKMTKPKSALFLHNTSRGIYTGKYMFVVIEEEGKLKEAYCYDNYNDPYQMDRIPLEKLDLEVQAKLKKELYALLQDTNDSWIQENICMSFLQDG